jgi:hypothetical protein
MKTLFHFIFIALTFTAWSQPLVKLEYFDFKVEGLKVKLMWEVTGEKNLKQYNLFRSVDNNNFYLVGEIPSHGGHTKDNYTHLDHTASGGINYYKLVAVAPDNTVVELARRNVDMIDMDKMIYVTPNVESGTIHLNSAEQIIDIEMELVDMLGRTFRLSYVRDSTHELTIVTGPIEKGAYYLVCKINGKRYARVKTMFIPSF